MAGLGDVLLETGFWKRSWLAPIPLLLSLQAFLFLAFLGIFAYFVLQGTRQTSSAIEARTEGAAHVVATNAAWMSEVARQTLRRIDVALGENLATDTVEFEHMLQGRPSFADVYVVDQSANTVFATVPGASQVSILDRAYFTEVRDGLDFYISALIVSRLTNEPLIVFSKRLERRGQFAGAAMVSFPAGILEPILHSLDLPEDSAISLVRTDGMLIARIPPTEGPVDLSNHPLMTEHLPAASVGTYASPASPVDGITRVVSYRLLPGTNMIALASTATSERWAQFHSAIVAMVLIIAPILLALILGTGWATRLMAREARRKAELEEALAANKLLIREIHHRVKNNLQSVRSLVALQNLPASTKQDLDARLRAMAAMHEHIYQFDQFMEIDAHDYVPVIVSEILEAYGCPCEVVTDVDHARVDRDHATPLALLISELATNACKYAFTDGRDGELRISLKSAGQGRAVLTIADNGVGLAPDRPTGMGTRLIRGLVGQMGGDYTLTSDASGTVFRADIAIETIGHHTRKTEAVRTLASSS